MTLTQMIKGNAERAKASGITVTVNTLQGWVDISQPGQEAIFMQGDEGYAFIDEARSLWNQSGQVDIGECYLHCAMPYAENLWN